jgi:hypothetical protein
MHSAGLKRVYIGVESGSRRVLDILNKPMNLDMALAEMRQMKAAGIDLGVIIMAGAGGRVACRPVGPLPSPARRRGPASSPVGTREAGRDSST